MLAIFLLLLGVFLSNPVFAGDAPIQLSPTNNSTVSSSTLNWQTPSYTLYSSNPYRVQVDDDQSFPSQTINKDYYTKNAYYSPVLNEGKWYWRVKSKDSSGAWSNWSSIWSFTIQSNSASSPTPSPSPTSSTATPSPSISFTLSDVPSQINSDQSFNISINLSLPNSPNATLYLKGAFKKTDSSNYFGKTLVGSVWVNNSSNFSEQYKFTTDSSGNWSGKLELQPDYEDSGFSGSGDYIFKVGRYTEQGSGPTWSNEANIKIVSTINNDQGGTAVESSSNAETSSKNSVPSPSTINKTTSKLGPSKKVYKLQIATIAGEATQSATTYVTPQVEVKSKQQFNFPIVVGIVLIISGLSSLFYIYLQLKRNA